MKTMIIPDGQYIKCKHCGQPIKGDVAMLSHGEFYCFHDWVSGEVKDSFGTNWTKNTCVIKEK